MVESTSTQDPMNTRANPLKSLRLIVLLAAIVVLCATWCAWAGVPAQSASDVPLVEAVALSSNDWIVEAPRARALIAQGSVTVLDSRGKVQWLKGHVPGAQRVSWDDFTRADKRETRGILKSAGELTQALQALGVSASRPVLVVGNPPDNWGEDGRIVWMLRTLGHPKVAMVDGGQKALEKAGLKAVHSPGAEDAKKGDFVAKKPNHLNIDRQALKARLGQADFVALDTREAREFAGKTPYGESRGGHVAGAKHLHYEELFAADGRLLPRATIKAKLAKLGIAPDTEVAAYCTGGVRSGWMVVILQHLGYTKARNYAGSMWEWSAQDAAEY